jgi:hypothetical protein
MTTNTIARGSLNDALWHEGDGPAVVVPVCQVAINYNGTRMTPYLYAFFGEGIPISQLPEGEITEWKPK